MSKHLNLLNPKGLWLTVVMAFISILTHAQITGRVFDSSNGQPLAGANIAYDEQLVITDESGAFTLPSLPEGTAVQISFVGYETQSRTIKPNQENMPVGMVAGSFNLQEVVVSAYLNPQTLASTPGPVSLITKKDIQRDQELIITNALNRIPGIYMHSGTLNTNRITIRGIGSRSLFTTNRVRGYLNDIPLTSGEGETTIEDIDLSLVERVEIIRGPASSEYGAGLGGTINLKSSSDFWDGSRVSTDFQAGSYGLIRSVTTLKADLGNGGVAVNYNYTHSDGYRENNEYDRQGVGINGQFDVSEKTQVSFLANWIKLKAFIPSSLDSSTFATNPEAAAANWLAAMGFEDYDRGMLGVSVKHRIVNRLSNSTSLFTSFRNAFEVRPFNVLRENTNAFGIRSQFSWAPGNSRQPGFILGVEYFRDNYVFSTHENVDSRPGAILSDNSEVRDYVNLFGQVDWAISTKTNLQAGINLNQTKYELLDAFLADSIDQSGEYQFDLIASPRIGITHQFNKSVNVHATVSHGFAPPTLAETLTPDGQLNPEIQPETGYNFEIGSRGNMVDGKFIYDVTLFTMRVRNLLVAQRVAEDQFVGVNAGKTTHNGIELSAGYALYRSPVTWWSDLSLHGTYTLAAYSFKEFVDEEEDFSGNDLTGVPRNTANVILEFRTRPGWYGNFNYLFVDRMPIVDDNSVFTDPYHVVNFKTGWNKLWGKFQTHIYAGINNLFDEHYASMIAVNAGSFGGRAPRYFYPGLPRNYFGGIQLAYHF